MPKLREKLLTETLYCYTKPANNTWVRKEAKRRGVSYSQFVDTMIERARWRKNKTTARAA